MAPSGHDLKKFKSTGLFKYTLFLGTTLEVSEALITFLLTYHHMSLVRTKSSQSGVCSTVGLSVVPSRQSLSHTLHHQ